MSGIKFHPFVMLRTPAYSVAQYNEHAFGNCLKDPLFRHALQLASRSLYETLEKCGFEFDSLDLRTRISVRKYFNRMCFRPTPFGLFSSFTPIRWGSNDASVTLPFQGDFFYNTDLQAVVRTSGTIHDLDVATFYPNRATYQVGRTWRYLIRKPDGVFGSEHVIHSLSSDSFLKDLLLFCDTGKSGKEVKQYLFDYFEDESAAEGYLLQVLDAQLLMSEFTPNIVGEYFGARIKRMTGASAGSATSNCLQKGTTWISGARPELPGDEIYGVYEKISTNGVVDKRHQVSLLAGLRCLDKLTGIGEAPSLTTFKRRFISKFENQEVPLLTALDPEVGVGYGPVEHAVSPDSVCSDILPAEEKIEPSVLWGAVQKLLLSKWTGDFHRRGTDSIVITDEDLDKLPASTSHFPPGLSMVFRILKSEQIFIEQAGGVSGTALHGRFTPFDRSVLSSVRDMARTEMARNGRVTFAEIGYYNNEHAANINVREHLFLYEIPVLTHSTLPLGNQIPLNDIQVSVTDDQIILRSRRLDSVIIPRHSSAYNYNRSELPVFRFLCDLQYQGVKSSFGLQMKQLFPGLNFYPRVEYGACILSPATWVLPKAEMVDAGKSTAHFLRLAAKLELPRMIALTHNDHQLVFDLSLEDDVEYLIECIKKASGAELVEFLVPGDTVQDHTGNIYVNQFLASLYNDQEVYRGDRPEIPAEHKDAGIKRAFFPGEEWVYLKVYCHEAVADEILRRCVRPVISGLRREGIIDQWFFIRYRDPEPHLRIRVRKTFQGHETEVLARFNTKLGPYLRRGSVASLKIDTYSRELERYGCDIMEDVEGFFEASSDLALRSLNSNSLIPDGQITEALRTVDLILSSFVESAEERTGVLKAIYENLRPAFAGGRKLQVTLDLKFRLWRPHIQAAMIRPPLNSTAVRKLERSLRQIRSGCDQWPPERHSKLIADLLHMHVNRLFNKDQRKHELLICYLLYKYYRSTGSPSIYGRSGSGPRQYAS